MIDVTLEGNNVELIKGEMTEKKMAALEAVGEAAVAYAKLNLESDPRRIDTGNLRNSIDYAVLEDGTVVIGTDVEYAPYVELGTIKMQPSHFLKRAASEHSDEYMNVIDQHMKE